HSVQSLGKRLEKEKESLTRLPETEWAILPKFEETDRIINGKTVLDLFLPILQAGEKCLSENVRLHISGPERVCIIGQNGCGKTTLIKKIADMLLPRKDISVGYVPQNYDDLLNLSETPVEILAPSGEKESVTHARTYLGSMKFTASEMDHAASELSGGQRAKVLLLKLILNRNNVLLLDEPTRNFSSLSNPALRKLFASFPGCIIAVTHDRMFLKEVATRVVRLTETGLEPVYLDTNGLIEM
ncbi:MAG: ABC-F family ATP-binding cassette domain-containing protein, partial [Clostridia bacterium]|nr:ABC-F family ATP-binding cassette domain-containing protein [Clostridia bacterium]